MERVSVKGNDLPGQLIRTSDDTARFKYYRVSSNDAHIGANYDFSCNFGNDPAFDKVLEIHLSQVSILNGFPNVSANRLTSTFSMVSNALGSLALIIADGFYTTSQLMSTIQSRINLALVPSATTFALSQDPITNKITWTRTAGADTIRIISNGLSKQMGIMSDTAFFSLYTADTVPSLSGEQMIYIHSTALAPNLTYRAGNGNINDTNCAFSIPVNVPYGQHQTYTGNDTDRIVYGSAGKSIQNVDIRLRGVGNVLLNTLPPNAVVVIILKVFYA